MNVMNLLFVEDRLEQHILFQDAIDDWNQANSGFGRMFQVEIKATYEEAVAALERTRFDGALLDLRLPSPVGDHTIEPLGNALARKGLRENGIPVAIITALETELSAEITNSSTVKVFNKGDTGSFRDAVEWFGEKWLMMEVLAASRAHIQRLSADVFSDRIWPRWGEYVSAMGSKLSQLTPIVTRQHVWHMGEVLGLDGDSGILWHPFENYLCPPLQPSRTSTGDVFKLDESLWIVLSPACDLATGKVGDVLLAACDRDALKDWSSMIQKLRAAKTEEELRKASEYFRRLVNQGAPSQHFLPPLPGDPRPLMVQFSKLATRPLSELTGKLNHRVASVSAPFLTNLTQRFGAYISRVGQPNIDGKHFA